MHAVYTLLILLGLLTGLTLLFMMTAGWFTRTNGHPDDDTADTARAPRRPPPPPVCPVTPEQREWIERSMRWCAHQFGEQPPRNPVVLPTEESLLASYDASNYQIHRLYGRVCALMGVDPRAVELRLRDTLDRGSRANTDQAKRHIVGRYKTPPYLHLRFLDAKLWLGRPYIEVERAQTSDPVRLVAILAHELAHRRLLSETRVTPEQPDQERLTDLLTIYLGFGIFTANMQQGLEGHVGYLTVAERGYALACYCRLRAEPATPTWATHLHPKPRAILEQSLAFLTYTETTADVPSANPPRPTPPRGRIGPGA